MANDRVFLTLSMGISEDLARPVFRTELDQSFAREYPRLLSALRERLRHALVRGGLLRVGEEPISGNEDPASECG